MALNVVVWASAFGIGFRKRNIRPFRVSEEETFRNNSQVRALSITVRYGCYNRKCLVSGVKERYFLG